MDVMSAVARDSDIVSSCPGASRSGVVICGSSPAAVKMRNNPWTGEGKLKLPMASILTYETGVAKLMRNS